MSRYYSITVSPDSSPIQTANASGGNGIQTWTSMPNGVYDPCALNVQLDLITTEVAQVGANSTVTIEGIDFASLQQSNQYAGMNIVISGGMQTPGLPLVNPAQAGVLVRGWVYNSFGNWVGTEMNINLLVVAGGFTNVLPGLFSLQCPTGTLFTTAIQNMLSNAYPGTAPILQIKNPGQYVFNSPRAHFVKTFNQMAIWIKSVTKSATSPGISIGPLNSSTNTILIYDGSVQVGLTQLIFDDLIGQPQWLGGDPNNPQSFVLQFTTAMRADIQVGDTVMMPKNIVYGAGAVTTTGAANATGQLKLKSAFQGAVIITAVRHIGNFRDGDGAAWATVFQGVTTNAG